MGHVLDDRLVALVNQLIKTLAAAEKALDRYNRYG